LGCVRLSAPEESSGGSRDEKCGRASKELGEGLA
jgi:hypothetical protein